MEYVYHYTSICKDCESVFASILRPQKINFRATYFEKFLLDDYLWIKKYSEPIVKELCKEQKSNYEEGFYDNLPYIISFCTNPDSEYMWEKYGNKRQGIMLEFNKEILLNTHHDHKGVDGTIHEDLDCFCDCMYVNEQNGTPDISEIKETILEYANNIENHNKWNLQERLRLAISAIKKVPFHSEEEWRYMILQDEIFEAKPDFNHKDGCIISNSKVENWYKHIDFPIEALTSITVGDAASDYCFQCVRNHVMNCGLSPNIVHKRNRKFLTEEKPAVIVNNMSNNHQVTINVYENNNS